MESDWTRNDNGAVFSPPTVSEFAKDAASEIINRQITDYYQREAVAKRYAEQLKEKDVMFGSFKTSVREAIMEVLSEKYRYSASEYQRLLRIYTI
ncbi:MAG: hypothetical protein LBT30_00030 [Clostridiales bacterium]|jgi:hypothetical protein|nr:hypothetical protein [Clostridiales bacterium]